MKGSGKPQRLELKRSSSTVDSEPSTSMFSDSDDDDDDDDDDEDYDVESVRSKRSARKQKETKKEQNEKDASKKIPAGLEALVTMDSVGIKANTELVEMICGCESSNNYDICNSLGQKFYTAHEESWFCFRNCCYCCCGSSRPFTIEIKDLFRETVLIIQRPWRCRRPWCPFFRQVVTVELPDGTQLGRVAQQFSCCRPWFKVTSATGETVFKIRGPLCQCKCCGEVQYTLRDVATKQVVGKVAKNWSGLLKEALTDADVFVISFPLETDVKIKAVLLGSAFLLDYMYFENNDRGSTIVQTAV
ncbi:hypothetical protein RRG08_057564 [Elysia crispata]|uniref:Phospholipid scramblase n=1 Tax=Elysia crispata TaxID=231223 RepID=A0AAE1DNX0_9GAST|nr:hypothetical protein RRG08_057564 [Elysia crispata]